MGESMKKGEQKLLNEFNKTFFRIHRIDENVRQPNWKIDKVDRPYTVFWYVISGEKKIKINDIQYTVKNGDLVVFPSEKPFEILVGEKMPPMHHLEIAFENKPGSFNLVKLYEFPIITKILEYENLEELITLWRRLKNEWTLEMRTPFSPINGEYKFELTQTIQLLQFNAITMQWFVKILTLLQPYAEERLPAFDSRLQELFYFIDNHLDEKLSLARLAKEVYLSESHLSLLFRQNIKMSPMEFVRKKRMQKARELLLTTDIPLKEIAELIGFQDQTQLSRAFRQTVGVSPIEYRKKGDFI